MKKKICIFLAIFSIIFCNISYAENEEIENTVNTDSIIESQSETLGISAFLESADEYSTEVLEDINIKSVLSDAITGNIDNKTIGKKVLNLLFKEVLNSITIIRKYYYNYSNS